MPTKGWVTTCPWCHENVNVVPSTARRVTQRAESPASSIRQPLTAVRSAAAPTSPARSTSAPMPIDRPSRPPVVPPPQTTVGRDVVRRTAQRPSIIVEAARPNPPTLTDRVAVAPRSRGPDADGVEPGQETRLLATATFVTGTARLEPGHRYGIAIRGSRFLVVGPVDLDSKRIALDRPVADIQVSGLEGRLVVSEQGRSGVVLAFMSVAGSGLDDLAGAIRSAARNAEP